MWLQLVVVLLISMWLLGCSACFPECSEGFVACYCVDAY